MKTTTPKEKDPSSETLTSGHNFSDQELMRALYDVQDILERAICPFVLLGETARSIKDTGRLSGDGVYIGILKKYVTHQVLSTVKFYLTYGGARKDMPENPIRDDGFDYEWNGVPIHVRFIEGDYDFFKRQDFKFYMANEYRLPNPFETYWEQREAIT